MVRKLLLIALLVSLMSACAPQATATSAPAPTEAAATEAPASQAATVPAAGASLTLTDGLGREITLKGPAQKIVSLAPSNTEILFAVGAGSQVVGRDEFSDYPEEAKSIASVGGSFGEYSTEAIVALQPDLVLAAEINTPELVKQLEDLGMTVYYLKNPLTLEEMYANLQIVGQLSGHDVTDLVQELMIRVAAVDASIAMVTERPIVFYEIDASDATKPYTYGAGTFGDLIITRAGGINLATAAGITDPYPQLSLEQVVATDPNVIILGDAVWGTTPESVKARAGWDVLDAVQKDQIFAFDDNLVSRPGPRLVEGLEKLANLLHPDAFQ